MSEWGSGYVTDTAYVHDFCRVQTPAILSLAALAKSVATPGLEGKPLTYCELGCGQGFTANLVAAANPAAEVFAADFNPTHIAGARSLAAAAGLNNIVFREADFEELLHDSSLPDFDTICMHGVYSWISAQHRQTIVAFIRRRLKPAGDAPRPTEFLRTIHGASFGSLDSNRGRLGRSTVQFQREAAGASSALVGEFRQG